MSALRQARLLARLVLAWFVLAVGIAVAAPVVQPQSLEMICSGGSLKLVGTGDAGEDGLAGGLALDCPLCAGAAPPPPAVALPAVQPLGQVLRSIPAARVAALAAAPLPARGPPWRS